MRHRSRAAQALAGGFALALVAGCSGTGGEGDEAVARLVPHGCESSPRSAADTAAPCDPWLADSPQAATHGNGYRQSSYAGATSRTGDFRAEHLDLDGAVPIWVHTSAPYPDGSRTLWLNVASSDQVVKVDAETFEIIDATPPMTPHPGVGVAYNELNAANQLVRLELGTLEAWGEEDPDDPRSDLRLVARYPVPPSALCRDETLVGLAHTHDGHLVVGSDLGAFFVLPADPEEWESAGILATYSVNGERCADDSVPTDDLEEMSNTFSVDEAGGLFAVTDQALYRLDWRDGALRAAWRTPYDSATAGALGDGSGSTPTLMGSASEEEDQMVVITDAQRFMHLNVYWRDKVPEDWEPVRPGADPRLACSVKVDFGEPDRPGTKTDQSVTVDGYSSYVVDNTLRNAGDLGTITSESRAFYMGMAGGNPRHAPRGAARIDWDPATRTCRTAWSNPDVHFPNGIPMVASDARLMIGNSLEVRDGVGVFGMRALDADTGRELWFVPGERQTCTEGRIEALAHLVGYRGPDPALPVTPALDNACENGNFSGAVMGTDGVLYTGTSFGASRFVPTGVTP